MIELGNDIRSLSDFKRNTTELVNEMEESGHPMVLTLNGRARLVVQDAASYQKLLNALDKAEAIDGIRRGLKDVAAGKTQPASVAFAEIRKKHRIPRKAKP